MGLFLALGFYICFFLFLAGYAYKMLMWARQSPQLPVPGGKLTCRVLLQAGGDIFFLRRLLRVNDVLWFGEWIFHVSLFIVFLRHLRFILEPVPQAVLSLEIPGIIAAWLLPASLIYICVMKIMIEKKPYVSSYNFFLLGLLLALSASGLVMRYYFHSDLAGIKYFVLRLLSFGPGPLSDGFLFTFHFLMFLVLLAVLPDHIFAAPLTMVEARQREEELPHLIHDK